jgi:hypothetical protein
MRGRRNKQRVAINRKTKVDWQKTRSEETKTPRIKVIQNDEGTPKKTKSGDWLENERWQKTQATKLEGRGEARQTRQR